MAIVELVFPKLTKDPVLLKEAFEKIPSVALQVFKKAGVVRASRGMIDLENGKDVTADVKELVILGKETTTYTSNQTLLTMSRMERCR